MIPDWFLSHSLSYLLFLIYFLLSFCPDTDHDFLDSRVVRKLHVTETQATWSKDDWQICKSDYPDPNKWDSDICGGGIETPSSIPTVSQLRNLKRNASSSSQSLLIATTNRSLRSNPHVQGSQSLEKLLLLATRSMVRPVRWIYKE